MKLWIARYTPTLLIAASMPPGVEHKSWPNTKSGVPDLIAASMPPGVEHIQNARHSPSHEFLIAASMPPGVEHFAEHDPAAACHG